MIDDLVRLYQVQLKRGDAPPFGMSVENVPYGIDIDDDGTVIEILRLGDHSAKNPKNSMAVPTTARTRTSTPVGYPIWDNASYILGDPTKNPKRAQDRFKVASEANRALLKDVDSQAARAAMAFFDREPQWEVAAAKFASDADWQKASVRNFILCYRGKPISQDEAIQQAWTTYCMSASDTDNKRPSVLSGKNVVAVATHPKIKSLVGAQSSGASLVSFNNEAFCSYGQKQCLNAPMDEYEAFAYTTALNTLLRDRTYVQSVGSTTMVCWAATGNPQYQELFETDLGLKKISKKSDSTDENDNADEDLELEELQAALYETCKAISNGEPVEFDGSSLNPEEHFYVLGLAPNAARIAIRFYYRDSFSKLLGNVEQHYSDIAILQANKQDPDRPPLWRLNKSAVNENSKNAEKNAALLFGHVFESIMTGAPYPASLLNAINTRITAERKVTPVRAAVIKGYYLRLARLGHPIIPNDPHRNEQFKEVLQMSINEDSDYTPYVLGRLFSVYEQIQRKANPNIKATIKDKYFTSAASRPALVFGMLGNLAQKHLHKLSSQPGAQINLTKKLESLTPKIGDRFPERLTVAEQGAFHLGYYFEDQKQYQKRDKTQKVTDTPEYPDE